MKCFYLYLIHPGTNLRIPLHAVTSDTHFGHKNIAKYTGRPFDNTVSTHHMDTRLAQNWNHIIDPDENVLHLGDAALGKMEDSLAWYEKLHGHVALIPGNHDEISSFARSGATKRETLRAIYERVFEWILPESGVTLEAVIHDDHDNTIQFRTIQASHYPSFGDSHDRGIVDHYASLRPRVENGLIIHGHTHSHDVHQPGGEHEFHVGVDAHGLAPVRAEVIAQWAFGL